MLDCIKAMITANPNCYFVVYFNRKGTCFMSEYFDLPKLVLRKPWRMRMVQLAMQPRRDLKVELEGLEGWIFWSKKKFCYTESSLEEKIPDLDLL